MIVLPFFAAGAVVAVREVFRISVLRAIGILVVSAILTYIAAILFLPLFGALLAWPFLLVMLFLLGRGYITELTRSAEARASFKRNLETATLNPADASAHYTWGSYTSGGELEKRAPLPARHIDRSGQVDALPLGASPSAERAFPTPQHFQIRRALRVARAYEICVYRRDIYRRQFDDA